MDLVDVRNREALGDKIRNSPCYHAFDKPERRPSTSRPLSTQGSLQLLLLSLLIQTKIFLQG